MKHYPELLARYNNYEGEKTSYKTFKQRVLYSKMEKLIAIQPQSYDKNTIRKIKEVKVVNPYELGETGLSLYRTGAWSA